MTGVLFFLGVALVLVGSCALVVAIRRHMSLEISWYGLVVMGFGAAVAAYVAMMGAGLVYAMVALPDALPRAALARRLDIILINTLLLALLLEGFKSYAIQIFDTSMTRGNWTLYGFAVGLGAGICQAFWLLGAQSWAIIAGLEVVQSRDLWLVGRTGALVAMEASLGALLMYWTARNHRAEAISGVGALHGLALMAPAILILTPAFSDAGTWIGIAANLTAAAGAALALGWQVKRRGWPT